MPSFVTRGARGSLGGWTASLSAWWMSSMRHSARPPVVPAVVGTNSVHVRQRMPWLNGQRVERGVRYRTVAQCPHCRAVSVAEVWFDGWVWMIVCSCCGEQQYRA